MHNKIGIYHLFGENIESKKCFWNWINSKSNICEYDLQKIQIELFTPSLNTAERYFYFSYGNILDWLEENGYYVGLPLRGKFKWVTVCHFNSKGTVHQTPIYSNSGVKERRRAIELGVQKCIEHFEIKLKQKSII